MGEISNYVFQNLPIIILTGSIAVAAVASKVISCTRFCFKKTSYSDEPVNNQAHIEDEESTTFVRLQQRVKNMFSWPIISSNTFQGYIPSLFGNSNDDLIESEELLIELKRQKESVEGNERKLKLFIESHPEVYNNFVRMQKEYDKNIGDNPPIDTNGVDEATKLQVEIVVAQTNVKAIMRAISADPNCLEAFKMCMEKEKNLLEMVGKNNA